MASLRDFAAEDEELLEWECIFLILAVVFFNIKTNLIIIF